VTTSTSIHATDVRLQGARIVESAAMRRAGRLRHLLEFFIEEWSTCGERPISQRRLAEEVLGKGAGFSPTSDAHVRIYLRRLRQRLTAYYAGPGASDPLVLGVTAGAYRLSVATPPSAGVAAIDAGGGSPGTATRARRRETKPSMFVLLTELSTCALDDDLESLPMLVPQALVQHLLGRHGLAALGPVPRDRLSDPPCESAVVQTSAASHLLDGTMTTRPDAADGKRLLEIVVRLHDVETGSHVWSHTCSDVLDCRNPLTSARGLAARLAAAILAPPA
jgi:hypothetical protein